MTDIANDVTTKKLTLLQSEYSRALTLLQSEYSRALTFENLWQPGNTCASSLVATFGMRAIRTHRRPHFFIF
jgi:hypothetical protein